MDHCGLLESDVFVVDISVVIANARVTDSVLSYMLSKYSCYLTSFDFCSSTLCLKL